jgi:thymidylate synthase ThyX
MPIQAKVLADSMNPAGSRLTTLEVKCPRFILAEINTHRTFSRNARSSRAVPTAKLVAEVRADPVIPITWGRNRKGMSAGEELSPTDRDAATFAWKRAAHQATENAEWLAARGAHKQHVNRVLEPFMWAYVVISATDWANFYAQRLANDAQPEMQALALAMGRAMLASEPAPLAWGEWHLPYVWPDEMDAISPGCLSAARCARVSYAPFDTDKPDCNSDQTLANRLMNDGHWSPFEHQAYASQANADRIRSNFGPGWVQYRKTFHASDENRATFDWPAAVRAMDAAQSAGATA